MISNRYSSLAIAQLTGVGYEDRNIAIGGADIAFLNTNAPMLLHSLINRNRKQLFYSILQGVNDMAPGIGSNLTPQQIHDAIETKCLDLRARGVKYITVWTLPSNLFISEANRTAFNDLMRADYTDFADRLIDLGADEELGCENCYLDTMWFLDGSHLTIAGLQRIADLYYLPALQAAGFH